MKRVHVISATDSQVCIQRSSFVWPSDESLAGDRGYTLEMALLRDFNTQTQAWPCCFYPPSVPVPPFVLMQNKYPKDIAGSDMPYIALTLSRKCHDG